MLEGLGAKVGCFQQPLGLNHTLTYNLLCSPGFLPESKIAFSLASMLFGLGESGSWNKVE